MKLSEQAMGEARQRWDNIAKPPGSLGKIEQAIVKIAGIAGTSRPDLSKKAVVVLCADNGVVAQGVTQSDSVVTAIMADQFTKGMSSVCIMAKSIGADVFPVDIGIARSMDNPLLLDRKIRFGTGDIATGSAMTRDEAAKAVETGVVLAGELKAKGYGIIATGDMGIGNTTTSSAVASVLLCEPVEAMTGKGAGMDKEGLARKVHAIEKAIALNRPASSDALDVLAKVGGLDIAGMAGLFIGGAVHGIPVVIDGFISAVAALAACRIEPACRDFMLPSHVSAEPGARRVLEALGMDPLLDCGMRLGEGTGAVLGMAVLETGLAVYRDMVTFGDIDIGKYVHFTEDGKD